MTIYVLSACQLESKRLVLEPLRPEHANELGPLLNDVPLHRFIGGEPAGAAELRVRLERQVRGRSPDGRALWLNWTIRLRSSRRAVGTMQATVVRSPPEHVAELAWVIGIAYQRRGFAKEAAQVTADWLRDEGIHCLRAHIHPRHVASMAVARSIGLRPSGIVVDGEIRWESTSTVVPAIADNGAMDSTTLVLIRFTADHFPTLAGWFASEREVVQWGGSAVRFPLDDDQLRAMADESLTEPPTRLCWMARRDRELVGHVQLALDWRHGNALIGRVAIAPERRGQGLAVPMLELVLAEAFSIEGMERVELNVYTWNAPAIATYQRLGFRTEGIRRSATRVGDERWDSAMMSLLRTERPGQGASMTR